MHAVLAFLAIHSFFVVPRSSGPPRISKSRQKREREVCSRCERRGLLAFSRYSSTLCSDRGYIRIGTVTMHRFVGKTKQ